uniref:Uncharacterized protein n=1 Tax=Rhipicephalus zambeziensis TaxID=60191 RepID=A0A224Y6Q4_9ACAR
MRYAFTALSHVVTMSFLSAFFLICIVHKDQWHSSLFCTCALANAACVSTRSFKKVSMKQLWPPLFSQIFCTQKRTTEEVAKGGLIDTCLKEGIKQCKHGTKKRKRKDRQRPRAFFSSSRACAVNSFFEK